MYTYYGSISFQIVSIFFAAAFILATLPMTNFISPLCNECREGKHYLLLIKNGKICAVVVAGRFVSS